MRPSGFGYAAAIASGVNVDSLALKYASCLQPAAGSDPMSIETATREYEAWLSGFASLHQQDVEHKHREMASSKSAFPFLRGTYYRWVQLWMKHAGGLAEAPTVLGVGDLHVENFGTWRDREARLVWGINDFDEADDLPYTNDLVRLAVSVRLAKYHKHLDVDLDAACDEILDGYEAGLKLGGQPFVLEERHSELRKLAMDKLRSPKRFWSKLESLLNEAPPEVPAEAVAALANSLPQGGSPPDVRFRSKVGMGSLGKPRFVALSKLSGGWVCREAKKMTPASTVWLRGESSAPGSQMAELMAKSVRCPDPHFGLQPGWVIRRLAPHCVRIELKSLAASEQVERVFCAMGTETANVHLGNPAVVPSILKDLAGRSKGWLANAAREFANRVEKDWAAWRESYLRQCQSSEGRGQ